MEMLQMEENLYLYLYLYHSTSMQTALFTVLFNI